MKKGILSQRILAIILVLTMLMAVLTGCSTAPASSDAQSALKNGTYQATANGNNGPLTVEMTVADGKIAAVQVVSHSESKGITDGAIKNIPENIVSGQTLAVDTVSGATNCSRAILDAAKDCLIQAGGNPDNYATPFSAAQSTEVKKLSSDVLVIGAGLSGITSSLAAAENGAKVILIEKQSFAGGNAIMSTGILQAGGSSLQKAAGIKDSPEQYYKEMMELSEGKRLPQLVEMVTSRSGETIDWLIENGAKFNDQVAQTVGSTAYRGHTSAPDASGLVTALMKTVEQKVEVYYNTPATEFIIDKDGKVVGAKAKQKDGTTLEISANNVIMATGGFAASEERIKKFAGDAAKGMTFAGSPGTTGEMTEQAIALGADTIDMDQLFTTPTAAIDNGMLITALVLSKGAIITNSKGERFLDETASPNDTFNNLIEANEDYVFEVFDASVRDAVYKIPAVYMKQGIVQEAATLDELATKMGVPVDALKKTIETYNASVDGAKDPLGRQIFNKCFETAPYYFMKVSPGYLSTNGGVRIDEFARVVKKDGAIIPGLYATGDATGGYRPYGYVCGDANMLAAVTGRVAGEHASQK